MYRPTIRMKDLVATLGIMRVCRRADGNGDGNFFVVCAATGWKPHKIVVASAITLGITGWVWLWDELP